MDAGCYWNGSFRKPQVPILNQGKTRSQSPIGSTQGHVSYSFRRGIWAAFRKNANDQDYGLKQRQIQNPVKSEIDIRNQYRVTAAIKLPIAKYCSIAEQAVILIFI